MYACSYVCMYVCMCVYKYVRMYVHYREAGRTKDSLAPLRMAVVIINTALNGGGCSTSHSDPFILPGNYAGTH